MTTLNTEIVEAIKAELPTKSKFKLGAWILSIITVLGGIGSVFAAFKTSPDIQVTICVSAISLILIVLFGYLVVRDHQGLHRYSQAVSHLHFAAHVTRDALAQGTEDAIESAARNLVYSCATIFSIVTGKNCSVTVKYLDKNNNGEVIINNLLSDPITTAAKTFGLNTFGRSRLSSYQMQNPNFYSSIKSLSTGKSARCYISNNVYEDFRANLYYHPALLDEDEKPIVIQSGKLGFVSTRLIRDWPIDFSSTIVGPIRFLKVHTVNDQDIYDAVGFLCVDCKSRGVFETRYAPELIGAYADLLYLLVQANSSAELKDP